MNILISSYSFGAHRGSEAGVGWNVASGLAKRGHRVTVITTCEFSESNRRAIADEALDIRVVEADCGVTHYPSAASYRKWQQRIGSVIEREIRRERYAVIHHVTFNQYRGIRDVFAATGLPYLIGPIGGAELIPLPLMRYGGLPFKMRMKEMLRYLGWDAWPLVARCKKNAARGMVLVSNNATAERLRSLPVPPIVCPAIAIHEREIVEKQVPCESALPFILFDGGLARPQKGTWLALRTLKRLWASGIRLALRMVGVSAADEVRIRRYAQQISLPAEALQPEPQVSRDCMLTYMQQASVMLSCVYRDSGSMALLEALAQGCNIVCLDIPSQQWLPEPFCHKVQVQSHSVAMEEALSLAIQKAVAAQRSPEWHAARCAWLREKMTWEARLSSIEHYYQQIVS